MINYCEEENCSHFSRIDGVVHDGDPALERGHLEERDVRVSHVVKGDAGVDPLRVVLGQAGHDIRNDLGAHFFPSYSVSALC